MGDRVRKYAKPLVVLRNEFLIWSFLLWEPQKSKMTNRVPRNGREGLERVVPLDFGRFLQLLLNTFFLMRGAVLLAKVVREKSGEKNGGNSDHFHYRRCQLTAWSSCQLHRWVHSCCLPSHIYQYKNCCELPAVPPQNKKLCSIRNIMYNVTPNPNFYAGQGQLSSQFCFTWNPECGNYGSVCYFPFWLEIFSNFAPSLPLRL